MHNHSLRTSGETKNISSVGVLLGSETELEPGDSVEYLITLPTSAQTEGVHLRCLGKVVRRSDSEIAATLERYEFVRRNGRGRDGVQAEG